MPDIERLKHKLLVAKILLSRKELSHRKIQAILGFLNNYVLFQKKETNSIFIQEIDQITGNTNKMDIFEQIAELREEVGMKKGMQKASRLFVKNLLKESNFSLEKIASMANVSLSFVKQVKKSLKK